MERQYVKVAYFNESIGGWVDATVSTDSAVYKALMGLEGDQSEYYRTIYKLKD